VVRRSGQRSGWSVSPAPALTPGSPEAASDVVLVSGPAFLLAQARSMRRGGASRVPSPVEPEHHPGQGHHERSQTRIAETIGPDYEA
jgi:hypothetical protein